MFAVKFFDTADHIKSERLVAKVMREVKRAKLQPVEPPEGWHMAWDNGYIPKAKEEPVIIKEDGFIKKNKVQRTIEAILA